MDGGMVAWKVAMTAVVMAAVRVVRSELRKAVGSVEKMVAVLVEQWDCWKASKWVLSWWVERLGG